MSTITEQLITKQDAGHSVGYFTSIFKPEKLEGGAKCKADTDNTELVKLVFDATDDEVVYAQLVTSATEKADAIVMSPEVLHFDFENKTYFFNGKDTMATVYPLVPSAIGKSFKTNAIKVVDAGKGLTDVKRGWFAYYVPKAGDVKAHYALTATKPADSTAVNVFKVFNTHFEDEYEILGLDMVELEIL